MGEEQKRIEESESLDISQKVSPWEKWGPYVTERGWGTVREDYSPDGDAWNYFPHEHARMRAFRRCDDGIAGFSDRYGVICLAHCFWNGKDSILKERLFGLNFFQGNHGEDVKELYYYLDALPSHSYMRYLYKYPQAAYPYERLIEENKKRGLKDREFELLDTGIFDDDEYFDLFIEYAKEGPEDLLIKIEALNRGKKRAPLHLLPQVWFRNKWEFQEKRGKEPEIYQVSENPMCLCTDDRHLDHPRYLLFDYHLGKRNLYATEGGKALFTNNDTHRKALWNQPNATPYVKDAFHRYIIQQEEGAINPEKKGTKAAIWYFFEGVDPGKSVSVYLRYTDQELEKPLEFAQEIFEKRKKEADEFYASVHPKGASEEEKMIQRQALAGMIWSKQIYIYDVGTWLQGDNPAHPPPESHRWIRNFHWRHIVSYRIFSMPDKWEFPWFAAWDLAFQSLAFSLVDLQFAKNQVWLLLFDLFQHPNGSIPAYEWEFSDVNPPIQAWAVLKLFEYEKKRFDREDFAYLEKCFHKLLLNFSWWVNKVDSEGNNVFEGGFLGMDNIGFVDEMDRLPKGYHFDQADGAGWISLLCLNLMRMALMLAKTNPVYEDLGIKFFHHFVYVTAAMRKGYWRSYDMWNHEDGFFYSFLKTPEGVVEEIKVRSLIGLIPFFAFDSWDDEELKSYPKFYAAYQWLVEKKGNITSKCIQEIPHDTGSHHLFGLLSAEEIQKFLKNIWNPDEFRSEYGLRSLSKFHEAHPVEMHGLRIQYEPGESLERIKGGNSNWRGPIWFPLNFLLIDTLDRLSHVFKEEIKIQVKDEKEVNLKEMADSFAQRLLHLFTTNQDGKRPLFADYEKLQKDPHFKDYLFFNEHFHAETGRGLGASHQNGWTGLIANVIEFLRA